MAGHVLRRVRSVARGHRRALQVVAGALAGVGFLLALHPPLSAFVTPPGLGLAALGVGVGIGLQYAGADDGARFESPAGVTLVMIGVLLGMGLLYAAVGVVSTTFPAGALAGSIAAD